MSRDFPWNVLEIDPVADAGAVRRAYAARLKATDIDAEPHAYAELRAAREEALWLVREGLALDGEAGDQHENDPLGPAAAPPLPTGARWPYAAPELARERPEGGIAASLPGDPGATYFAPRAPALRGEVRDIPAGPYTVFTVPERAARAPADWLVTQQRRDDVQLYDLLAGDEALRETGLDERERDAAQRGLRALLRDADHADIARAGAIEQWLAETLARSWPRSAPLVPEAAAAFGWERMAGSLGELPAVAFLNARQAELRSHQRGHADPLRAPVIGAADGELSTERARLASLLRHGEGAMSDAEAADALALLQALVAKADRSTLTTRVEIEQWLAHQLAQGWPRSAPLLEPAFAAFDWEQEVGQLGEREAVGFLHARLKGLRFHAKVLEPGHPLHGAWVELSTPGPASSLHRARGKRAKVEQLLGGIRERFPELEHHLDAQRVASWERRSGAGGGGFNFMWFIIGFTVLRLLASLGDTPSTHADRLAAFPVDPAFVQQVDEVVGNAFGPDVKIDQIDRLDHGLAETIRSNVLRDRADSLAVAETTDKVRNLVRQRVYFSGQAQGGGDLDKAMRLRLEYLRAARAVSAQACMVYFRTGDVPHGVTIPAAVLAREQEVAMAMLRNGKLGLHGNLKSQQAMIPGEIIALVREDTKLPRPAIDDALLNKGSDANRCAVMTSLLSATLASRVKQRQTILHLL